MTFREQLQAAANRVQPVKQKDLRSCVPCKQKMLNAMKLATATKPPTTAMLHFGGETVNVTVVCYNRLACTQRTLAAFKKSAEVDNTPFHLVLVDNGSTDGTAGYLKKFVSDNPSMKISIITFSVTTDTISEAVNRGWAYDRSCSYFVKLDNDVEPKPGFLGRLKAMLDAEPVLGQVGIAVADPPNPKFSKLPNGTPRLDPHSCGGKPFVWGACSMTRADVLNKVGVLCEMMARHEDAEFSLRLNSFGYQTAYLPDERLTHFGAGGAEGNRDLRHEKYLQGVAVLNSLRGRLIVQKTRWA